jgi:hypothetical protein
MVRCLCGQTYDLMKVTVIARYADCDVWKAPCCGRTADNRKGKSLPDYRPVEDEYARRFKLLYDSPFGTVRFDPEAIDEETIRWAFEPIDEQ